MTTPLSAPRKSDLQTLLRAIVNDDRSRAEKLLKSQPSLAAALVDEPKLYRSKIDHWLYVNDSALHLAAAGHRVELVRMLLAAGADPNLARNHRLARPLHYAADGY